MHTEVPGSEHDIRFAAAVKYLFFQLPGVLARSRRHFEGANRRPSMRVPWPQNRDRTRRMIVPQRLGDKPIEFDLMPMDEVNFVLEVVHGCASADDPGPVLQAGLIARRRVGVDRHLIIEGASYRPPTRGK